MTDVGPESAEEPELTPAAQCFVAGPVISIDRCAIMGSSTGEPLEIRGPAGTAIKWIYKDHFFRLVAHPSLATEGGTTTWASVGGNLVLEVNHQNDREVLVSGGELGQVVVQCAWADEGGTIRFQGELALEVVDKLKGGVGVASPQVANNVNDVALVQHRLQDLGYPVAAVCGVWETPRATPLRLFQWQKASKSTFVGNYAPDTLFNGVLTPKSKLAKAFWSSDAPRYDAPATRAGDPKVGAKTQKCYTKRNAAGSEMHLGMSETARVLWDRIVAYWELFFPHTPAGTQLNSGLRTIYEQRQILYSFWNTKYKAGIVKCTQEDEWKRICDLQKAAATRVAGEAAMVKTLKEIKVAEEQVPDPAALPEDATQVEVEATRTALVAAFTATRKDRVVEHTKETVWASYKAKQLPETEWGSKPAQPFERSDQMPALIARGSQAFDSNVRAQLIAPPGRSNHNQGLALDCIPVSRELARSLVWCHLIHVEATPSRFVRQLLYENQCVHIDIGAT